MHTTPTSIAQCISQTIWDNGNYSWSKCAYNFRWDLV